MSSTRSTLTDSPAPYFTPCNPLSERAQVFMDVNRVHWGAWTSVIPRPDEDAALVYGRIAREFGITPYKAERNVMGVIKMSYLPKLTRLQEENWFLDLERIGTIGRELHSVDADVYPHIDDALVELFTPTRPNQILPDAGRIRRVIQEVLAQFYVTEGDADEELEDYRMLRSGRRASFRFSLEATQGEAIHRLVRKRAAAEGISYAAALAKCILEPVKTTLFINSFQSDASSLAFVPGFGYLNPEQSPLAKKYRVAEPGGNDGYRPNDATRAFVEGRDGTCRYVDCDVPASDCQLDHRINYEDGGPTSSDNLLALCQKHHNIKTDTRAFYILDPITGDVYWLFADGTWAATTPSGPIATKDANWRLTIAERMDLIEGHTRRVRKPPPDDVSFDDD